MPIQLPVKPTLQQLVAPQLFDLQIPTLGQIAWPNFTLTVPDFTIAPPASPQSTFVYTAYGSTIQSAIESRIEYYLAFEYASHILMAEYVIGRYPIAKEFLDYEQKAFDTEATTGVLFPRGAFVRSYESVEMDYRRKLQTLGAQTVGDAYKFISGIREFALKAAHTKEAIAIDSHNKIQAATFKYASTIADIAIESFKVWVRAYTNVVSLIRDYAELWKMYANGQLAVLEEYEAIVQGVLGTLEKDSLLIELYNTRIELLRAEAALQEMEITSVVTELLGDQAILSRYGSEIDLYLANINKNTAEFKLYSAKTELALTDFEKWKILVGVTEAELRTAETQLDANLRLGDLNNRIRQDRIDSLRMAYSHAKQLYEIALDKIRLYEAKYQIELVKYEKELFNFIELRNRTFTDYLEEIKQELKKYRVEQSSLESKRSTLINVDSSVETTLRISDYEYDLKLSQAEYAAHAKLDSTLIHKLASGK